MANQSIDRSNLPKDLLGLIGQRLTTLQDVIRAGAVCKSWSSNPALLAEQQWRFRPSTQLLMLPYCSNANMIPNSPMSVGCKGTEHCRCFYDVAEQKPYHVELPRTLGDKPCRGSAFGWLFMVQQTPSIYLLNPLTGDQIHLPPITTFPDVIAYRPEELGDEYLIRRHEDDGSISHDPHGKKFIEKHFISRVAMSADPATEECVVMIVSFSFSHHRLAFCKPGRSETWTTLVDDEEEEEGEVGFQDVVFWKGQFYAIDFLGRVFVCNLSLHHQAKLSLFHESPQRSRPIISNFNSLVACGDRLMMVARYAEDSDEGKDQFGDAIDEEYACEVDINEGGLDSKAYWTERFRVFKLNGVTKEWDEVESIDGCGGDDLALFLGFNSSTLVSTKLHPGLVPNSINFTDNLMDYHHRGKHGGYDMGVYNLTTRTIQPLYSATSVHYYPFFVSPLPAWYSPSESSSLPR